jgi:hypothetical protein
MTATPTVQALAAALDHVLPIIPSWILPVVFGVLACLLSTVLFPSLCATKGHGALLAVGVPSLAIAGGLLMGRTAETMAERSAVLALAGRAPTAWFRHRGGFGENSERIIVAKLPADTSPAGMLAAGNSVWAGSVTTAHLDAIEREVGGPGTILRAR